MSFGESVYAGYQKSMRAKPETWRLADDDTELLDLYRQRDKFNCKYSKGVLGPSTAPASSKSKSIDLDVLRNALFARRRCAFALLAVFHIRDRETRARVRNFLECDADRDLGFHRAGVCSMCSTGIARLRLVDDFGHDVPDNPRRMPGWPQVAHVELATFRPAGCERVALIVPPMRILMAG